MSRRIHFLSVPVTSSAGCRLTLTVSPNVSGKLRRLRFSGRAGLRVICASYGCEQFIAPGHYSTGANGVSAYRIERMEFDEQIHCGVQVEVTCTPERDGASVVLIAEIEMP